MSHVSCMHRPGGASFILGGQWGSEGKGAAAAHLATKLKEEGKYFDIATTNAGAQAGHTSTHCGITKVVYHLPTVSLYSPVFTYLNAGSIIDPAGLMKELEENPQVLNNGFAIHPNAAIITPECREAEMDDGSAQTRIASTRKGVGQALSRKILRDGAIAADLKSMGFDLLEQYVHPIDLNREMSDGKAVLVEVPQGHSLSIDEIFYPYCTSRNCTVMQGMSDAGIHPSFYRASMLVLRTFPIRVGNIYGNLWNGRQVMPGDYPIGHSGGYFPDQQEITWDRLGVEPEITTVTKRIRRVFTFSDTQAMRAIGATRPDVIYLTFCDYLQRAEYMQVHTLINRILRMYGNISKSKAENVKIITQWGPTTDDVREEH